MSLAYPIFAVVLVEGGGPRTLERDAAKAHGRVLSGRNLISTKGPRSIDGAIIAPAGVIFRDVSARRNSYLPGRSCSEFRRVSRSSLHVECHAAISFGPIEVAGNVARRVGMCGGGLMYCIVFRHPSTH